MFGGFRIKISSRKLIYDFMVNRKITKIEGYSATGKTQLLHLVSMYNSNSHTRISIESKYPCRVITRDMPGIIDTKYRMLSKAFRNHKSDSYYNACRRAFMRWDNAVYFIDEDDISMLDSICFAAFCKYTDAFFVIMIRSALCNIPYSYKDIYVMKESGKYHFLERKIPDSFSLIPHTNYLVEDSNSGYEALTSIVDNVVSAGGNSNIVDFVDEDMLIIADGAAIGPFIEDILETVSDMSNVDIYLPESFEYLVLTTFFKNSDLKDKINNPEKYCTGLHFSWERYFTELLEEHTKGFTNKYSKSKLNECYIKDCCYIDTYALRKNCNMLRGTNKLAKLFPALCGNDWIDYKQEALDVLCQKGKTETDADEIYELAKMSSNIQVKDKWEAVIKFKDYL